MEQAVKHISWIGLFLFCLLGHTKSYAQKNPLQRPVTFTVNQSKVADVLLLMEQQGGYGFSYNSNHIPGDSLVSMKVSGSRTSKVLATLLGPQITVKVSGQHLILINEAARKNRRQKKKEYVIRGYIRNANTGEIIRQASIYQVEKGISVLTNAEGYYETSIELRPTEFAGLSFSRKNFRDTVIIIQPKTDQQLDIALTPHRVTLTKAPSYVPQAPAPTMDSLALVRLVVADESILQSLNMPDVFERRLAQVSFVPKIGTNGNLSGLCVNNFSFNVLAGYSYGVDGFEMAGISNINRSDLRGFQLAGFSNVLGGDVRGWQVSGFLNHTLGRVKGVQVTGFSNTVLDTMSGVQVAGFSNFAKGSMTGVQVAGFSNLARQQLEGWQVAGFTNITSNNINAVQLSGFANYGEEVNGLQLSGFGNLADQGVNGAQISGFGNIARGKLKGLQIAGFLNVAESVSFLQVAGFVNKAKKQMNGIQIAGFLNRAESVKGLQVGIINLSDTMAGLPIGLFSYAKTGFHHYELSTSFTLPIALDFKTGAARFHNIFSAGFGTRSGDPFLAFGYGFGSEWGERKWQRGINIVAYGLMDFETPFNSVQLLQKSQFYVSHALGKKLKFLVGPTLEYHIADRVAPNINAPEFPFNQRVLAESRRSNPLVQVWVGGKLGIRF